VPVLPDLIIAEKPSVARSIAEALGGATKKGEGFLEAGGYVVTWAIGHLVDIGKPEDYDEKYKSWDLSLLPIMPERFRTFARSRDTQSQLKTIGEQARLCNFIICATDAGREGEAIFRLIYEHLKLKNTVKRLWVSSLTKEAIVKGMADLRPGSHYDSLWASARVRNVGDWLVGMNASRAFSKKFSRPGDVYSVGRVQTPTLAILVRRELEIQKFVSKDYFTIKAILTALTLGGEDSFTARWEDADGNEKLFDERQAVDLAVKIGSASPAVVRESKIEDVAEHQPQLYDLTTLQRECNKRFGMTAAKTLEAAQSLYESKAISYPRTDCRYVSADVAKTFAALVPKFLGRPPYEYLRGKLYPKYANRPAVINDSKITDHHAIIPTDVFPDLSKLKPDELRVYDLVAWRFLAQFMPPASDRRVRLILDAKGERLGASGTREIAPGWRLADPKPDAAKHGKERDKKGEAEDGGSDEIGPVPELAVGDRVRIDKAEAERKKTLPKKRFSEASLLGAMENAGRELDDEGMREAMKGRGLGTPATRAAIIERLKEVGFIDLDKKTLVPTEKGIRLVALCEKAGVQRLTSPEMTGEWEQRLNLIAEGKESADKLESDLRAYTAEIVQAVIKTTPPPAASPSGKSYPPCPLCGGAIGDGHFDLSCGCGLKIPKQLLGRALDEDDITDLLTHGHTALLAGFTSKKTGKAFNAVLKLTRDTKTVSFDFTDSSGTPKEPPARKQSGKGTGGSSSAGGASGRAPRNGDRAGNSRPSRSKSNAPSRGAGGGQPMPGMPKPAHSGHAGGVGGPGRPAGPEPGSTGPGAHSTPRGPVPRGPRAS